MMAGKLTGHAKPCRGALALAPKAPMLVGCGRAEAPHADPGGPRP